MSIHILRVVTHSLCNKYTPKNQSIRIIVFLVITHPVTSLYPNTHTGTLTAQKANSHAA